MIGHDGEFSETDSGKMTWDLYPGFSDNPTKLAGDYLMILDAAEDAPLLVRTDRHEIQSGKRIVEVLQPHGLAIASTDLGSIGF